MNGVIDRLTPFDDGNGGFGFVKADNGDRHWFKYFRNDRLASGQAVTFETRPSNKFPDRIDAFNVRPVGSAAPAAHGRPTSGGAAPSAQRRPPAGGAAQGGQRRPPATQTQDGSGSHYLPVDTTNALFSGAGVEIQNVALTVEKYIRKSDKLKIRLEKGFSIAEKKLLGAVNAQLHASYLSESAGVTVAGTLGAKMVVGLGTGNVFELGIILHKPYGFPYIPGSSLKGALRHLIIREAFGGDEASAGRDDKFSSAFGFQGSRGRLFFYDAYPKSIGKLELDIFNPHFTDYYMKGNDPTDTYEPVPVMFYAVPSGTEFTFCVGSAVGVTIRGKQVREWLEMLLVCYGIGAKTAVGYGWMQSVT